MISFCVYNFIVFDYDFTFLSTKVIRIKIPFFIMVVTNLGPILLPRWYFFFCMKAVRERLTL